MSDWVLFVDESGKLEDEADVACVGGLLLEAGDAERVGGVLLDLLKGLYPHVRYPPHATLLNLPAGHLAAWMLTPGDHVLAERLRDLEARFHAHHRRAGRSPAVDPFLNAVARREMPAFRDLALCDGWLRVHAVDVHAALEDIRAHCEAGLVERLAQTAARLQPRKEMVMIAAIDVGTALQPSEHAGGERYLHLVRLLFEKLYLVLRDGPPGAQPRHRVKAIVAGRHVKDASRPLDAEDLEREAQAAAAFPLHPPASGGPCPTVQIRPVVQRRYDGNVHPGIVLADFLTNRLRQELCQGHERWIDVERALARRTGLAATVRPRIDARARRPTLAVSREPWRLITEAFARARSGSSAGGSTFAALWPAWSHDCVRAWSEVAGRLS